MKCACDGSICCKGIIAIGWILCAHAVSGQFDANFTLQNVWGNLKPGARSLIQCLSDENHKIIKFRRMLDTGQGPKLPRHSSQFLQAKPVFARVLQLREEDKQNRFGVFQCRFTKKNVETGIVTLKLPPPALVELEAVTPYTAASVGDDVDLRVKRTQRLELPLKWMHDGNQVTSWDGLLDIRFSNVQQKDAGVYECFYEGRRNESVHALMRLVVRGCPPDLYGKNCDKDCPACYNGGICHEEWGLCVCPAGFTGTSCEIACGGNHFGADCSKNCSPTPNNNNTDELCALHLFCKPDPYGCSCAPGFKGSRCSEHCEPGWYGADCKQPCHCAYGISNCNRITGACEGGCARGWRGNSCHMEDPHSNSTYVETTTMLYCPIGTYGPSCEKICHCARNEHCHIITGHCASGCEDGWVGPACGVCRSGGFGDKCESTCHCEGGHQNCDREGFCYFGCEAGWAGFTCQAECISGRFGPNCASSCHCHNSSSPCHKISGQCEGDCEAGYMGNDCQTLCPHSTFGVNCANHCTCSNLAQCNRVHGSCACDGRWRGHTCNESEPQIVAATDEEVNTGQQVFLSCTADAVPVPQMDITCSDFPGLRVSLRPLEKNQQQAVIKIKPDRSGHFEFKCMARNQHGFDMKTLLLTVVDPPRLLAMPELLGTSNNSVTIQWKKWNHSEDQGGLPADTMEYLVVYRELRSSDWSKAGVWRAAPLSATLENLRPNTLYEVAVQCRRGGREDDIGAPSPGLQLKTECGVALPDGIPQEFLLDKISQTGVTLTWEKPPVPLLQCALVSYRLTFYAENTLLKEIKFEGAITSAEIEELTPNTNYVVRLYPVTELGESQYYAELILQTSETIPGPVSDLKCHLVEGKSDLLLVSWEAASEEYGILKGYVIKTLLLDRGQCGDFREEEAVSRHFEETEITLQKLNPFSVYNVSVQARTSAGEGAAVSKLVTTLESVPSASPPNVRVTASTHNSLSFAWDPVPCEGSNGDIIYYDYAMLWNDDPLSPGVVWRENISHLFNSVPDVKVTVSNLNPFTSYGFRVGGATVAGRGTLSDVIFHKTEEGVPTESRYLTVESVSDQGMEITWREPEHPNGLIIQYRIRIHLKGSLVKEILTDPQDGATRHSLSVVDLKSASEYIIKVEAATKAGWGKATQVLQSTLDGAPGEPSEVSCLENEQGGLNISWKKPHQSNGVLTGYKINYRPVSTLDPVFNTTFTEEKELEVPANTTEKQLKHLHPSTQYKILVAAKTDAGYGPAANALFWTVILGDHVSPSLKMMSVEATNDTIPIVFSTTGSSSVYKYQVIVEFSLNNDPIDEEELSDFNTAVVQKGLPYYIAAELDPSNVSQTGQQAFVVGDRQVWGGYKNVHLNPGHEYKIRIRTLILKDRGMKFILSNPKNETVGTSYFRVEHKKPQIVLILTIISALVFLIVTTCILVFAICYRRERKKSTNSLSTRDSGLSGSMTWSVMYKVPFHHDVDDSPIGFRTFPKMDKNPSLKRSKSDGKIVHGVRVDTLEDYLINAQCTNALTEEFKRLVDGQISSWTVARKSGNLKKNRYGNILPYDRFRVVLNIESNKSDSDYINASYIDGYRRPREYIVTQGPLENTIHDFWRMVWQENSPIIVMVTNLVENGKKKCVQYWPDDNLDSGDLHILLIHTEQCKDFVIRTLLIRKIDEIRTHRVIQYHFTGWPDRTVPSNTTHLIKLIKKVRDDHPIMGGPIVVHCGAGAGRSGTYVAIDALCQQASEDKRVDVFRFVNNASHQRVHLVQTLEQYSFIYEALVEAIQYEDTSVPLEKIGNYLKELNHMSTLDRRALILKQYNKLNKGQKKEDMNRCSVALSEANIFKNRDPLTVPKNSARVALEIEDEQEEQTDYINAINIDGYLKPHQFIVTQMPMAHTTEDFWRLVYHQRSSLIVMLNGSDENDDLNVGIYWPEFGESRYGDFEVQLISFEEQAEFVIRIMRLSHRLKMNDEPFKVIQIQFNGWMSEMKPSSVLRLIEMVELWHRRSVGGPITVHCMDGATRSGLFVAANHVCDQVESEGILDVFQIVKDIRATRPELIPNSDQFRLLFEVAQEVAEPFLQHQKTSKKLSFKI